MNTISTLSVVLAVLSDASYALIVGSLLADRWLDAVLRNPNCGAIAKTIQHLARFQILCLGVLSASHLVRPWFVAASMSGSQGFRENLSLIPAVLSSTRQGVFWYSNLAAIAILFAAHFAGCARKRPIVSWFVLVAISVVALTKTASSHAADEGDFTLVELSQFLHLLATAVWAGTILVSGFVIAPFMARIVSPEILWNFGGRLSRTVTWAVVVLVLSGIYTSDRELSGSLSSLWRSAWGRILLLKIAFVGVALCLGAASRIRCVRRAATHERAAMFAGFLRAEAAAMAAILCISGLLANTSRVMP